MVDTNKLFKYEIQGESDFSWMIWESDYDRLAYEKRAELLFERFKEMNIVPVSKYEADKHDGRYVTQQNQSYQRRQIGDDTIFDRPCMMVIGKAYNVMTLQEEFRPSKEEKPGQAIL